MRDDVVVLNDGEGGTFAVGADGRQRWVLPKKLKLSEDVPAAILISEFGRSVDTDKHGLIAAAYQSRGYRACWSKPEACGDDDNSRPDLGIVALSADKGTPVWSATLNPSIRGATDPKFVHYRVKIVTDTAVLVEIVPELYDKNGNPARTPLTVALDTKTGQQLWSQYGLVAEWGDGDRILASRLIEPSRSSRGTPEVLDARTGQRVWTAPAAGYWAMWGAWPLDLHGYGIVFTQASGESPNVLVGLATGRVEPVGKLETSTAVGWDATGPFRAHAELQNDNSHILMSQNLPDGTSQRAGNKILRDTAFLTFVAAGSYLWGDTDDGRSTTALDRTGAQRLKPVPGQVMAVDDNWLITAEQFNFTDYRLS